MGLLICVVVVRAGVDVEGSGLWETKEVTERADATEQSIDRLLELVALLEACETVLQVLELFLGEREGFPAPRSCQ